MQLSELEQKLIEAGYTGNFDVDSLMKAIGTTGDKPVFKFLSCHSKRPNGNRCSTQEGTIDMNIHGNWNARARTNKKKETGGWVSVNGWGFTAQEALANLWLALHTK
jgi:hypothetical protein